MTNEIEMWDGFIPCPTFGELPEEFVNYMQESEVQP